MKKKKKDKTKPKTDKTNKKQRTKESKALMMKYRNGETCYEARRKAFQ